MKVDAIIQGEIVAKFSQVTFSKQHVRGGCSYFVANVKTRVQTSPLLLLFFVGGSEMQHVFFFTLAGVLPIEKLTRLLTIHSKSRMLSKQRHIPFSR